MAADPPPMRLNVANDREQSPDEAAVSPALVARITHTVTVFNKLR